MDINNGFKIDTPDIFVSWEISDNVLVNLFKNYHLTYVTADYYTAKCKSLNGLECEIGFHFRPRPTRQLVELEFFRSNYHDRQKSFVDFQKYFELSFGQPTSTTKGNEGFNKYEWLLGNIQIVHDVYDRFGPEEHMRIRLLR
jgi:hypothetical protein